MKWISKGGRTDTGTDGRTAGKNAGGGGKLWQRVGHVLIAQKFGNFCVSSETQRDS